MQGFKLEIDGVTYVGKLEKDQVALKVDDNEFVYMSGTSAVILGMAIAQLGDQGEDE